MILYIDTRGSSAKKDQKIVKVTLKNNGKVVASLTEGNEYGSQVLLPLIEKILKKNKLEFTDLTAIEVEIGPGSFTGLRVGVSIANALGFSLKIPVNGKKIETELVY